MNEPHEPGATQQTFTGATPREAIARARTVLGRDAVILEQRQRNGVVEIVASRDFPTEAISPRGLGEHMRSRLGAAGFEPSFADAVDEPYSWQELPDLFRSTLQFASPGSPLTGAWRFLGAPGVGKTTTIIKLMAEHVLRYGRHGLQLVSTDTRRLAGCEQLALAAELLDVPYLEIPEAELGDALERFRTSSLVLVDSAGVSAGRAGAGGVPGVAPAATRDVLVVPAMWQIVALRRSRQLLGPLSPAAVALTHVDQAPLLGPCLSVLAAWRLPLVWLSRGPELPEDLEAATPELLAKLIYAGIDRSQMSTTFA